MVEFNYSTQVDEAEEHPAGEVTRLAREDLGHAPESMSVNTQPSLNADDEINVNGSMDIPADWLVEQIGKDGVEEFVQTKKSISNFNLTSVKESVVGQGRLDSVTVAPRDGESEAIAKAKQLVESKYIQQTVDVEVTECRPQGEGSFYVEFDATFTQPSEFTQASTFKYHAKKALSPSIGDVWTMFE